MLRRLRSYRVSILLAVVLSLAVATIFLYWHPSPANDLFAYFSWMDTIRALTPDKVWHFIISRGEFVTMGYMYIIATSGIYGLFQFFPTFISLFIIQYIVLSYCSRKRIPLRYAWLGIFTFISMYEVLLIPSGVRSTIGFAVVSLALYLEFELGKKNARWLYALAPFIHLGMIIPVSIRLFMNISNSLAKKVFLATIIGVSVLPVSYLLMSLTSGASDTLSVNMYKLGYYMEYFAPWSGPFAYKIVKSILILFICWKIYKIDPENKYNLFYLYASILTISLFGHYLLWYRILEMTLIGSPLLIAIFTHSIKSLIHRTSRCVYWLIIIICILVGVRVQSVYFRSDDFSLYDTIPLYNSREH